MEGMMSDLISRQAAIDARCKMQIIIDIDDKLYGRIFHSDAIYDYDKESVVKAIVNGTPLPKGHGDLIDRSKIYKAIPAEEDNCTGMGMTLEEMDAYNDGIDAMYMLVKGAKPIIKEDKAESEDKE